MRWRGIILLIGVSLAVILLAVFLAFHRQESYRCTTCNSWRHVSEWRVGLLDGSSLPLWPAHQTEDRSAILKDFFASDHRHEWVHSSGHSVGLQGEMWSDGEGANVFCKWYARDPSFRAFVRRKIAARELSRETVLRIVALPENADRDERADPATEKSAELGDRLVAEWQGKE